MMLDATNIDQIVIDIHNIARQLEQGKEHWVFGKDLRDLADRLSRVHKNYCLGELTKEEKFAYDYARVINGLQPLEEI